MTAGEDNTAALPRIFLITPTYDHYSQAPELTRLCSTFRLVPSVHWIVVEDAEAKTAMVKNLLHRCGVSHTHLCAKTLRNKTATNYAGYHKGVEQRNYALDWLVANLTGGNKNINPEKVEQEGVVYFADDDNTYSLELFENMRYTHHVSVWPVGMAGGLLVEKPIVDNQSGIVTKFNSMFAPNRAFPVDMAAFAISVKALLAKPWARFSLEAKSGFLESEFLRNFAASWAELEPMAKNCTQVLVWHTKTSAPDLTNEKKAKKEGHPASTQGLDMDYWPVIRWHFTTAECIWLCMHKMLIWLWITFESQVTREASHSEAMTRWIIWVGCHVETGGSFISGKSRPHLTWSILPLPSSPECLQFRLSS